MTKYKRIVQVILVLIGFAVVAMIVGPKAQLYLSPKVTVVNRSGEELRDVTGAYGPEISRLADSRRGIVHYSQLADGVEFQFTLGGQRYHGGALYLSPPSDCWVVLPGGGTVPCRDLSDPLKELKGPLIVSSQQAISVARAAAGSKGIDLSTVHTELPQVKEFIWQNELGWKIVFSNTIMNKDKDVIVMVRSRDGMTSVYVDHASGSALDHNLIQ